MLNNLKTRFDSYYRDNILINVIIISILTIHKEHDNITSDCFNDITVVTGLDL